MTHSLSEVIHKHWMTWLTIWAKAYFNITSSKHLATLVHIYIKRDIQTQTEICANCKNWRTPRVLFDLKRISIQFSSNLKNQRFVNYKMFRSAVQKSSEPIELDIHFSEGFSAIDIYHLAIELLKNLLLQRNQIPLPIDKVHYVVFCNSFRLPIRWVIYLPNICKCNNY